MTDATPASTLKAPPYLLIVGVLELLWNAIGAFDYVMTETRNSSYMSSFTADQLAYFNSFPKWAIATWALGVWGGVIGSLLLIFRRRLAVVVFTVSLLSVALTFIYNFVLSDGLRIMGGTGALLMPRVILLIGALLLLYSRRMVKNEALR
jgi:hypothetical protein